MDTRNNSKTIAIQNVAMRICMLAILIICGIALRPAVLSKASYDYEFWSGRQFRSSYPLADYQRDLVYPGGNSYGNNTVMLIEGTTSRNIDYRFYVNCTDAYFLNNDELVLSDLNPYKVPQYYSVPHSYEYFVEHGGLNAVMVLLGEGPTFEDGSPTVELRIVYPGMSVDNLNYPVVSFELIDSRTTVLEAVAFDDPVGNAVVSILIDNSYDEFGSIGPYYPYSVSVFGSMFDGTPSSFHCPVSYAINTGNVTDSYDRAYTGSLCSYAYLSSHVSEMNFYYCGHIPFDVSTAETTGETEPYATPIPFITPSATPSPSPSPSPTPTTPPSSDVVNVNVINFPDAWHVIVDNLPEGEQPIDLPIPTAKPSAPPIDQQAWGTGIQSSEDLQEFVADFSTGSFIKDTINSLPREIKTLVESVIILSVLVGTVMILAKG